MFEIHFDSIDSTNIYLKNHYLELDNYTIVSSDTQTSGKGRNNRKWYASKNNLLFSILIKDLDLINKYKAISITCAYAIIKVLQKYGLNNSKIKWPNDILVNDKKICGILLEAISTDKIECLIIGIGINVNEDEFNDDYLIKPTSLKNELNIEIDIKQFKDDIYRELELVFKQIKNNYDFYKQIKELDYLKGLKAYALINNEKKLVEVIGINDDYSLRIISDNKQINMEAGEISFHL